MTARRGLIAAALLCLSTVPAAQARDASASGDASASVVRPLRTTALADLSFGAITVGGGQTAGGSVTVAALGNSTSFAGSVRPLCNGGGACQPHPARFAVSGEGARSYRVALPASLSATGSRTGAILPVERLTLHSSNSAGTSGGLLDASGNDRFTIGGTLQVAPGTPADSYRAEFSVTVSYD
jgi:hypothetical protein